MAELQVVEEKAFEAGERSRLFLSLPRAEVRLRAGEPGRIRIAIAAAGETAERARHLAGETRLRVRFHQGTARVEATAPPPDAFQAWCALPEPVFRAEVELPPACHVDAASFGGQIDAKGLEGHLVFSVQSGALVGRRLAGRVEEQANASAVRLEEIGGKRLRVRQACGHLDLQDVNAKKAALTLTNADAEVARIQAALQLALSDANCAVADARGSVAASVHAGKLTLRLPAQADAPVRIEAARAALSMDVPASFPARLDLKGRTVDFGETAAFEGEREAQSVIGTLNGGDVPLVARSVEGDVQLTLSSH